MEKNLHNTISKIRERGYWKVRFLPVASFAKSPTELIEAITKSQVQLRGWYYPHVPGSANPNNQAMYLAGNYYEGWIDWDRHKEVWRLFQNGQFIHNFSIWEDWSDEDEVTFANDPYRSIKSGEVLSIIGTVYSLTEVFIFLRNLYDCGFYNPETEIDVEISLVNTEGRKLAVLDPRRAPLFGDYACHIQTVIVDPQRVSGNQIQTVFKDIALNSAVQIFHQFQWFDPPLQVLKEDQKNLIERRW